MDWKMEYPYYENKSHIWTWICVSFDILAESSIFKRWYYNWLKTTIVNHRLVVQDINALLSIISALNKYWYELRYHFSYINVLNHYLILFTEIKFCFPKNIYWKNPMPSTNFEKPDFNTMSCIMIGKCLAPHWVERTFYRNSFQQHRQKLSKSSKYIRTQKTQIHSLAQFRTWLSPNRH